MAYSKNRIIARSIVWFLFAGILGFLAYECLAYGFAKLTVEDLPNQDMFKKDAFKSESMVLGMVFLFTSCCSFIFSIFSYKKPDTSDWLKTVFGALGFIGLLVIMGIIAMFIFFAFAMSGGIA